MAFSVNEMRFHVHCFLMAPGQACSDYKLKDRVSGFVGFYFKLSALPAWSGMLKSTCGLSGSHIIRSHEGSWAEI